MKGIDDVTRKHAADQAMALVGAIGISGLETLPMVDLALAGSDVAVRQDFVGKWKGNVVKGAVLAAITGDWTLAALALGPQGSATAPGHPAADAFLASLRLRTVETDPVPIVLPKGTSVALPAGSFRVNVEDTKARDGTDSSFVYYLPGRGNILVVEEVVVGDCLKNWDSPGKQAAEVRTQQDVKFMEPVNFGETKGWYLEGAVEAPGGTQRATGVMSCGPDSRALQLFVGGKPTIGKDEAVLAHSLGKTVRFGAPAR
jgi:hypothetical protein